MTFITIVHYASYSMTIANVQPPNANNSCTIIFLSLDNFLCRQINIPVLPAGLQIMADQGFRNRHPVIVLPRFNQAAVAANVRR